MIDKIKKGEENDPAIKETPSPKLRLVSGGGSGDDPIDWLTPLEISSVFLAKPKNYDPKVGPSFALTQFHVTNKSDRCTKIMTDVMGQRLEDWVDPMGFCLAYRLIEVLIDGKELNEAECNRPNPDAGLGASSSDQE